MAHTHTHTHIFSAAVDCPLNNICSKYYLNLLKDISIDTRCLLSSHTSRKSTQFLPLVYNGIHAGLFPKIRLPSYIS